MSILETIETRLPEAVAEAPCVDLDVRPVLAAGGEPFALIMETAAAVPPRHVLRLRATFKPVPLFAVMRAKGWGSWVAAGAGDDWTVCFYRRADFA
ncbi:MAG TPA: DUF2249 domain-containing protein [Rubricoccaceae bacterium]|nr:DUF2249 domain-containing protein [Rubricoccaceae bacterium]